MVFRGTFLLVAIFAFTVLVKSTEASKGHCKCRLYLNDNQVKVIANHCHRGYAPVHKLHLVSSHVTSGLLDVTTIKCNCHCMFKDGYNPSDEYFIRPM